MHEQMMDANASMFPPWQIAGVLLLCPWTFKPKPLYEGPTTDRLAENISA